MVYLLHLCFPCNLFFPAVLKALCLLVLLFFCPVEPGVLWFSLLLLLAVCLCLLLGLFTSSLLPPASFLVSQVILHAWVCGPRLHCMCVSAWRGHGATPSALLYPPCCCGFLKTQLTVFFSGPLLVE